MLKKTFLSERFMLFVIVLNAFIIFALAFPNLEHNETLLTIDRFFILLFIVEATVKISVLGFKNYLKNRWNVFDFVIVISTIPELFSGVMEISDSVTFILIFRLLRLIRLVRFMKFVPNMASILRGLGRAFKASIFVFLVLFFMIFILAVLGTHMYAQYAPEYFKDPFISSFTIFQLFTMEGWNEIPATIAKNADDFTAGFARIYFALVVLTGGIFGMSLANAIFVDEMTLDNNNALEAKIDVLEAKIDKLQELLLKSQTPSDDSQNV